MWSNLNEIYVVNNGNIGYTGSRHFDARKSEKCSTSLSHKISCESHVNNVLLFRLEFRKDFQPFESGKGHQTL